MQHIQKIIRLRRNIVIHPFCPQHNRGRNQLQHTLLHLQLMFCINISRFYHFFYIRSIFLAGTVHLIRAKTDQLSVLTCSGQIQRYLHICKIWALRIFLTSPDIRDCCRMDNHICFTFFHYFLDHVLRCIPKRWCSDCICVRCLKFMSYESCCSCNQYPHLYPFPRQP